MLENTERPVNFTYPEEEAMWHADNPAPSQKEMDNSPKTTLELIQKQFDKEFTEFKRFLDGKLTDENGEPITGRTYFTWFYRKLCYIYFPKLFEQDVKGLGKGYWDDLDWVDRAWIKNTRDLINEYHKICVAEQAKIWPEMAEGEK